LHTKEKSYSLHAIEFGWAANDTETQPIPWFIFEP